MAKKRVFFRGAYNLYNFGDDLTLIGWLHFLEDVLKYTNDDLELYIAKGHGSIEKLRDKHKFNLKYLELSDVSGILNEKLRRLRLPLQFPCTRNLIEGMKQKKVSCLLLFMLLSAVLMTDIGLYKISGKSIFLKHYFDFFKNVDALHYLGGGYFADWWAEMLFYEYFVILAAKAANPRVHIIGTGLGLGPFKEKGFKKTVFELLLRKFDYLCVRDMPSFKALEDIKIKAKSKILGDDALLLFPYFTKVKNSSQLLSGKQVALNLKSFREHNYSSVKEKIQEYIRWAHSQHLEIGYFCFGRKPGPDDHKIAEIFDQEYRACLVMYDPYGIGWQNFLKVLSRSESGIGFAYHFGFILALMDIPVVSVYSGEYYRQKIESGLIPMAGRLKALSLKDVIALNLPDVMRATKALPAAGTTHGILYEKMSLEYTRLYQDMTGITVRTTNG